MAVPLSFAPAEAYHRVLATSECLRGSLRPDIRDAKLSPTGVGVPFGTDGPELFWHPDILGPAFGRLDPVPIRTFLEGEVFDPELIETMSQALLAACRELGLRVKDDAATRLLALRIIEQAREGVHDFDVLKAAALKGLGPVVKH